MIIISTTRVRFPSRGEIYLYPRASKATWGPFSLQSIGYWALSLRVNWSEREDDYSTQLSVEVYNGRAIPPLLYVLME
jgi:hypothetical protein